VSITAVVKNYINFSGDQSQELIYDSGDLTSSPSYQQIVTLAIGNNTITVPDVTGFTVHGLAIVPPAANLVELTIKGVNGDTGLALSSTQVSVLQFGSTPPADIVLNVAAELVGLRLIWF
jgi:hypothetical protein